MPQTNFDGSRVRLSYFTAGVIFIVTLTLYLMTLAPSVVTLFDDSLEFQLVTYRLGIAHPTGYPLYTLLGKLFTYIPIGNIAYRVNLMSAVFGAATAALLCLLIQQIELSKIAAAPTHAHRPRWPVYSGSAAAAIIFAVGLVFWRQATVAEVYTLNAFFVALILWVAAATTGQSRRPIFWLAFLTGLSLTHHRTTLLLVPALLLYLLLVYKARLFNLNTILLSALIGLTPLLLYLYLPLRGHIGSLDGTYQNSWSGFWQHVTASGYGLFIFDNPFGQERDLAFYWTLLADQFYTTVPGLIGLLYLIQRGPHKVLALTGVAFITYFSFNIFYNVADIEVFFIPVFLVWAVWSGLGAIFLLDTAATLKYPAWRRPAAGFLLAVFALIVVQLLRANYPALQQAYTWQVHDYGLDILQQPLPPEEQPVIVGILGEMTLVRYFQQTEQLRPDIETVAADLEADRRAALERLLDEGKTVYLTRPLPGLTERYSLAAVGPLIRVNPTAPTEPPELPIAVDQAIIPEISLHSYRVSRTPHTGSGPAPIRLTLAWQANQRLAKDLKVSARLLDPQGQVQAVVDGTPVHFAYPTSSWRPQEIIVDVFDLVLPADVAPGQYTPLIIWYDPARNAAEVGRIMLEPVVVKP